ncbi:MAG: methylenetetrahydrofolate reductase [Actinomycetota bacterium]
MTQITYDHDALAAWSEIVRARGILERAAVLVGVAPTRSAEQARYLSEHLPGVTVPPEMIALLEQAGPDAEALGVADCVRIVTGLREIPGSRAST